MTTSNKTYKNNDINNRACTCRTIKDENGTTCTETHSEEYGTHRQYNNSRDYVNAYCDLLRI